MIFDDSLFDLNGNGNFDTGDLWILYQIAKHEDAQAQEEMDLDAYLKDIETEVLDEDDRFFAGVPQTPECPPIPAPQKPDFLDTTVEASGHIVPTQTSDYTWRNYCLRNPEYGVFPEKYETEREYYLAYLNAKKRYFDYESRQCTTQTQPVLDESAEWRRHCIRDPECKIYPEDYDNRMDYYKAYLARKRNTDASK